MAGVYTPISKLGEYGTRALCDTVAWTGRAIAFEVMEDTVFSVLTGMVMQGAAIGTVTWKAGLIVFGNFTAITLTSGKVAIYLGEPART
jgi:hypothetical protein